MSKKKTLWIVYGIIIVGLLILIFVLCSKNWKKGKEEGIQDAQDAISEAANVLYDNHNTAAAQVIDITELENFEVLKISKDDYQILKAEDNKLGQDVIMKFTGVATYTIDMEKAYWDADKITLHLPSPKVTFDIKNTELLYLDNDQWQNGSLESGIKTYNFLIDQQETEFEQVFKGDNYIDQAKDTAEEEIENLEKKLGNRENLKIEWAS